MEIVKIEKTGRKATIAGFDLDNRDKCKWKTISVSYTTKIPGPDGEELSDTQWFYEKPLAIFCSASTSLILI